MTRNEKDKRHSLSFTVEGMTCATCVRHVERSLSSLDGVLMASVSLASERAVVVSTKPISFGTLAEAVQEAGYKAVPGRMTHVDRILKYRRQRLIFMGAFLLTMPLVVLMVLHMAGSRIPAFHWLELSVGAVVLFFFGSGVLKGAWIALRHWHTNMDTLVSLGALTALSTSVLRLGGLEVMSFASLSPMLITLHLGGRYVESRLRDRATRSLRSLLSLRTRTVSLLREGTVYEVPVDTVKPGDTVIVKSGEKIALDGRVVEGAAYVDESMVTGEPHPTRKESGMSVIGGTILTGGSLTCEVEKVGGDTYLSHMIRLVEEAQSAKVPIQALADRITMVFIPVVFSLAVAAGLAWFFFHPLLQPFQIQAAKLLPWISPSAGPLSTAIFAFVTTLLIACPCALGLATPMALAAASGLSARRGIIIRNGEALQHSHDIDMLILDKTGTLTEGRPRVVSCDVERGDLAAAMTMEARSQHPIAQAVVAYGNAQGISPHPAVKGIDEQAGKGVSGRVAGHTFFVGKPRSEGTGRRVSDTELSITRIEVRKDGRHAGYITVADPLRPDAVRVVKRLVEMGITPIMVSGDAPVSARAVARRVGIGEVHAGVSPEAKAKILRDLQVAGHRVGMVGDGINDAAALKSADLGIAMGTGTELAMESGDIVLAHGELSRILDAFTIARTTLKKIKQNLFWAFFYNLVSIPLAMAALLHPLIAEGAMTLSSINVILNSGRISGLSLDGPAAQEGVEGSAEDDRSRGV